MALLQKHEESNFWSTQPHCLSLRACILHAACIDCRCSPCHMPHAAAHALGQVHQELLGQYYSSKFGVDFRSLRYPGVISSMTLPGGGTTDYAVEIFHAALTSGSYACFLGPDTSLPFLYMPDCLDATYELIMADSSTLSQVRTTSRSQSVIHNEEHGHPCVMLFQGCTCQWKMAASPARNTLDRTRYERCHCWSCEAAASA